MSIVCKSIIQNDLILYQVGSTENIHLFNYLCLCFCPLEKMNDYEFHDYHTEYVQRTLSFFSFFISCIIYLLLWQCYCYSAGTRCLMYLQYNPLDLEHHPVFMYVSTLQHHHHGNVVSRPFHNPPSATSYHT